MGQSAWVFQDAKQKKKLGNKASWYVGWYDPDGKRRSKSCGPGSKGKQAAFRLMKQIEAELLTDTYQNRTPTVHHWSDFREKFEQNVLVRQSSGHAGLYRISLNAFERICKPDRLDRITAEMVDRFIAIRLTERGNKAGSTVSPATVNQNLRYIRMTLETARRWEMIDAVPDFQTVKEFRQMGRVVPTEHFQLIYPALDAMHLPKIPNVTAPDWWRALLVFIWMTGWRIGQTLNLLREDVDLDHATAFTRAANNKGRRDESSPLHPIVVEHLRQMTHFERRMFHWPHRVEWMYKEFRRIQKDAGISLRCDGDHTHTDACHVYGFHDFRRSFATRNASKLTASELQALMQHADFSTTQRYIKLAEAANRSAEKLDAPDFLLTKNEQRKNG